MEESFSFREELQRGGGRQRTNVREYYRGKGERRRRPASREAGRSVTAAIKFNESFEQESRSSPSSLYLLHGHMEEEEEEEEAGDSAILWCVCSSSSSSTGRPTSRRVVSLIGGLLQCDVAVRRQAAKCGRLETAADADAAATEGCNDHVSPLLAKIATDFLMLSRTHKGILMAQLGLRH